MIRSLQRISTQRITPSLLAFIKKLIRYFSNSLEPKGKPCSIAATRTVISIINLELATWYCTCEVGMKVVVVNT